MVRKNTSYYYLASYTNYRKGITNLSRIFLGNYGSFKTSKAVFILLFLFKILSNNFHLVTYLYGWKISAEILFTYTWETIHKLFLIVIVSCFITFPAKE